ncbi:hypothetical protein Hanom_Chr05g00421181 [Helianthus anomalus]
MPYENWLRTIDHFLDPKYIARCEANRRVHQLHQIPMRGGTMSYTNLSFNVKQGLKCLDTYRTTHNDKDGNWVDPCHTPTDGGNIGVRRKRDCK